MAQDRFINITLDPNVATRIERSGDNHSRSLGAAASGDITVSYDSTKFTSLSVFRSTLMAAVAQAAGTMKP